jgi:hypothetical protein
MAAISTANLKFSAEQLAAISERAAKAFFGGGLNGGGKVTTADLLTFAAYTNTAKASASLSQARSGNSGINGDSTKGY